MATNLTVAKIYEHTLANIERCSSAFRRRAADRADRADPFQWR